MRCKAVHDEEDIWEPIEAYLAHRTPDKFTLPLPALPRADRRLRSSDHRATAIVSAVETLARLRRRLPLPVFVLLLVMALLVLGFACACITDHPAVAIERALTVAATLPPLVEVWSLFVLALAPTTVLLFRKHAAVVRGSPADLQRFLF